MKLRVLALNLTILLLVAESDIPAIAGDSRLAEFLSNFEQLDKGQATRSEWLGPKSPFAPYLKHSVVEALGESERVLYGRAFNAGACRVVRMLGTIGFLNRYTHLAPAFERSKVRATFGVYILPILMPDQDPCTPDRRGQKPLPHRQEMPVQPNPHG